MGGDSRILTVMLPFISRFINRIFSLAFRMLGVDTALLTVHTGIIARIIILIRALFCSHAALPQFFRFSLVGTVGLLVDIGVLTLCTNLFGLGLYSGRILSYLVAATTTWFLNRIFTFHGTISTSKIHTQWAKFILVSIGGFTINYGTYATLVATQPFVAANPWLGVAAGSIAGLALNFFASRKLVFR